MRKAVFLRDQRDYSVIAWERERVMLAELVLFTKNRETFDSEIRLQKAGLREIRSPQREYPKALLDVVFEPDGHVSFIEDVKAGHWARMKRDGKFTRTKRLYGLFGDKKIPVIKMDNKQWEVFWPCHKPTVAEPGEGRA